MCSSWPAFLSYPPHGSIYRVHDEVKDKLFELELAWVCADSGNRFQIVPQDLFAQAEAAAKQALDADEMQE